MNFEWTCHSLVGIYWVGWLGLNSISCASGRHWEVSWMKKAREQDLEGLGLLEASNEKMPLIPCSFRGWSKLMRPGKPFTFLEADSQQRAKLLVWLPVQRTVLTNLNVKGRQKEEDDKAGSCISALLGLPTFSCRSERKVFNLLTKGRHFSHWTRPLSCLGNATDGSEWHNSVQPHRETRKQGQWHIEQLGHASSGPVPVGR